jgi:hypothetical protein
MADLLHARVVFLLTLLGLTGCSVIATLHPEEPFDPDRIREQAGRNLAVHLEIKTARASGDWLRGEAHPLAAPAARIEWIWFRPPEEGPLPGDHVHGHALLSADGRGAALIMDGPRAARVEPGPHPVAVHWRDLVATPERFAGRLLAANGVIDGETLLAPDGRSACPLTGPVPDSARTADRHVLRLVREAAVPGWACRIEA